VRRFIAFVVLFWASLLLGLWAARQRPAPIEPEDVMFTPPYDEWLIKVLSGG
jgi:hypothetical protein